MKVIGSKRDVAIVVTAARNSPPTTSSSAAALIAKAVPRKSEYAPGARVGAKMAREAHAK